MTYRSNAMLVVVGSINPVKLRAASYSISKAFGGARIIGKEVSSGVSPMPKSAVETLKGAENRAVMALASYRRASLGVGLEAGMENSAHGPMLCEYAVIKDKAGRIGVGGGTILMLPKSISSEIEKGKELGELMDRITGVRNTKQKYGAVGFLTHMITTREESFRLSVAYALAPFLNKDLYSEGSSLRGIPPE